MNTNEINLLVKLLKGEEKSITLEQAFKNFMINAKLSTREQTQAYYQKLWKRLKEILFNLGLESTNDITKITYKHIELELKKYNYSNNSINKYTDILKMVIKYNFDMEYINSNRIMGMKKLPKDNVETQIIKKDLKDKILDHLNSLEKTDLNIRNISFMMLFADTGVRINELLNIKFENLNIEDNEIYLSYTKTKNTRSVYFSNKTKEYLRKYVTIRNKDNVYLFTTNTGNKMLKDSVYNFTTKIKRKLNIDKSISPHKWRHTLATFLLEENININQVKEVLGHTELTTTKKYLHADKIKTKKDVLSVL